ncbi:DC-STAMP domain-containing protein 2 [Ascaphus truei]|uniref:DC-STAMP domain-containing protein 2 n=1 Tax=Ascaphus truei TaxID=8439 RepID=UPI003F5A663F
MYGAAFFIAVFGVYMKRLRRSICAHYYPSREQERICYLYNNLLTKRTNIGRALIRSVNMNVADKGHISILLVLAAKFRCFRWFAQFMGVNQEYCMACAKISLGIENEDFVPCITNGCKGLYCQGCYELLDNVCTICMAPLAFTEAMNEEIDSSDEEKILLWVEAMKSIKQKEKEKRKKMKRLLRARLREVITSSGSSSVFSDELLRKYGMKTEEEEDEDEDMETSEAQSGQESGETDFEYQDKSDTSDASEPETQSLVPQIKLPDPRRQADLVSPVLFGQMISMNTRRWQEADVEKGVSGK